MKLSKKLASSCLRYPVLNNRFHFILPVSKKSYVTEWCSKVDNGFRPNSFPVYVIVPVCVDLNFYRQSIFFIC